MFITHFQGLINNGNGLMVKIKVGFGRVLVEFNQSLAQYELRKYRLGNY